MLLVLHFPHILYTVAVLQNEECLRPGETCDVSFLEKLEDTVGSHPHFVT